MKTLLKRREFLIIFIILTIGSGFFVGEKNVAAKTPSVIINEIMWMGSSASSSDEWIELRNMTNDRIIVDSWILTNVGHSKQKNIILSGEIKPNNYYLIAEVPTNSILNPIPNLRVKLMLPNKNNVNIQLKNNNSIVIDEAYYSKKWNSPANLGHYGINDTKNSIKASMERNIIPGDGLLAENWHTCESDDGNSDIYWKTSNGKNYGTPGAENSKKPSPIIYSSKIRINEIVPNPEGSDSDNEYVELYNYGEEDVELDEGWMLADADRNNKNKVGKAKKIKGIIEKNGGFLEIKKSISLNNDWDVIYLLNPNEEEIDKVSYDKVEENYSYSFDGKKWRWTPLRTPNEKNEFPVPKKYPEKIYINEILPNPSGDEKLNEYIEIYNFGNQTVDLSQWILKDSSKRGRFVFSENSLIKSKNYLVIYRSDFKFAMNNSGSETVYLLDPNEKIVSSISYSKAKEDVSYNFNKSELNWRWSRFLTPGEENKFNKLPRVEIKKDKKIYKNAYADFKVKINDPDKDKTKVVWDFGDGRKSYKKETRHKYKETGKYSASLKVFDGSEEIIKKLKIEVKKFPRPKVRITRLLPNPKGKDSELEWIEIKNKSKKEINLKNWSLATGSSSKKITNHPIYEDFFIKPGKVKKIMRDLSKFSLNNKKCRIELRYPDGKVAYKVKYKKEDGVKDDEVYGKVKGGKWKWTESVEDVLSVETVLDVKIVQDVQAVENVKDEEEIKKFINRRSLELSDDKKLELLIGELDAEVLENLILNLADSDIKEINNTYVFNSLVREDEHYALKFLEKLFQKINQTFNNRLNLLN